MVDHVVFVPGLCGSELLDGAEQVWPGTAWEKLITRYPDELADKLATVETLTVGAVLDKVSLFGGTVDHFATGYNVALDLLKSLGFDKDHGTLTPFPYDWRKDIRQTAHVLHDLLGHPDLSSKRIGIVAHSMGGLVARYALENLGMPANVHILVLAAVPHHGAPAAFQNLIGARPEVFLSAAQCKRVASNPHLPAPYQLLPHPAVAAFQDIDAVGFHLVDLYDPNVHIPLGLSTASMQTARQTWAELAPLSLGWSPPCPYFAIAGCEGETIVSNNLPLGGAGTIALSSKVAGDGTVPLWSAAPPGLPCRFVPCDHLGVFEDGSMRTILQGLLRPAAGIRPFAADTAGAATALSASLQLARSAQLPRLSVQVAERTVQLGQQVTASLVLLDGPQGVLDGQLAAQVVTPQGTTDLPEQTISYSGAPIRKLDVVITPNQAGLLAIDFHGRTWADDPLRKATVLVLPN